jgi:hypothetical protein
MIANQASYKPGLSGSTVWGAGLDRLDSETIGSNPA